MIKNGFEAATTGNLIQGPTAPNVTTWNGTSETKLGFGVKNMISNVTWSAPAWKPFDNGTVNRYCRPKPNSL